MAGLLPLSGTCSSTDHTGRLGLAQDERRRLRAHFMCGAGGPPTPAVLRKRASLLPESQRRKRRRAARGPGRIGRRHRTRRDRRLARLFDLLGLERAEAYSQVDALGDETLTRMRTAGAPAADYSIPEQPRPEVSRSTGAVVLDPELIKTRLAESARAASYLAEIFTDDDTLRWLPCRLATGPGPRPRKSGLAGLDTAHSALLGRLAARPSWTRNDFDADGHEPGLAA